MLQGLWEAGLATQGLEWMLSVRAAPGHVSGIEAEGLVIWLLLGMSPRIHQGNQELLLLLMWRLERLTIQRLDRSRPFRTKFEKQAWTRDWVLARTITPLTFQTTAWWSPFNFLPSVNTGHLCLDQLCCWPRALDVFTPGNSFCCVVLRHDSEHVGV